MGRHFSFWECLSFFFQKAIDFFNRVVYNIGREDDEVYLIDGSTAFVTGAEIEEFAESIKVYNLEIADFNTYFVGNNAVLVHNYDKNKTYPDQNVYVLYDDKGNIQYVGRSKNGDVRLDQHSRLESRCHLNGFIVASGIPYETLKILSIIALKA